MKNLVALLVIVFSAQAVFAKAVMTCTPIKPTTLVTKVIVERIPRKPFYRMTVIKSGPYGQQIKQTADAEDYNEKIIMI